MSHTVTLDQFEGPLDLLLHLIEQEELDVTAIALATVCEQYLTSLRQIEDRSPEEVADFLVVAAKLLYLKSLALVPGTVAEAEGDATGLADQLRLYRAFLEASRTIEHEWRTGPILYAAERMPMVVPTFFPPPRLGAETLRETFAGILSELEPIVRIPRAVVGRVISIEERIAEIRRLIVERPCASFAEVLRGRSDRQEVIVSFLALLELVKQRVICVEQEEATGAIAVVRLPYARQHVPSGARASSFPRSGESVGGYAETVVTDH